MDFTSRGTPPTPNTRPPVAATNTANAVHSPKRAGSAHPEPRWLRFIVTGLLFSLTILVAGVASLLYSGNPNEGKYIDTDHYQAIFLNNDQVYFAKIDTISPKFLVLRSIFYLNQQTPTDNSQAAKTLSLIKLGCEVHGPFDQMVINRDQVTFWENVRDNGKVAQYIATYFKKNPNGQDCSKITANNEEQAAQAPASTPAATTPSSSAPAKKP